MDFLGFPVDLGIKSLKNRQTCEILVRAPRENIFVSQKIYKFPVKLQISNEIHIYLSDTKRGTSSNSNIMKDHSLYMSQARGEFAKKY